MSVLHSTLLTFSTVDWVNKSLIARSNVRSHEYDPEPDRFVSINLIVCYGHIVQQIRFSSKEFILSLIGLVYVLNIFK